MSLSRVIIIAGSPNDAAHVQKIEVAVKQWGITVVIRLASAHKVPRYALDLLKTYEDQHQPTVYITVAGRSNALSGFVDGAVVAPVIACPPPSEAFQGADIFSSLRMPSGIAPGVVLAPENAALLAAKILALGDDALRERILLSQRTVQSQLITADHYANSR